MTPVRQCAAVRRQCASALLIVTARVRQCAYIEAHTHAHTQNAFRVGQCADGHDPPPPRRFYRGTHPRRLPTNVTDVSPRTKFSPKTQPQHREEP
ncbi:MAG: hypothetical protein QOC62_3367 [Mycobacterium sp.]|jgi:hypothetical protein|nr:hypothetical protein [Mycobacterium sp.]